MKPLPILFSLKKYKINPTKLEMILRLFYGCLAFVTAMHFCQRLLRADFAHAEWLWPVGWIGLLPVWPTLVFIMLAGIAAHFAAATMIYSRPIKFLSCALYLLMCAIDGSVGHFGFHLLSFLYCGFCFAFIRSPATDGAERDNRFYFFSAQLIFVILYSLAGYWKVVGLVTSMQQPLWWTIDPLNASLNYSNLLMFDFHTDAMAIPTWFGYLLWVLMIVLELSGVGVVFYPGLQRLLGISLFVFHAATGVLMKIFFWPHALLLNLILISHPYELIAEPPVSLH